MSARLGNAALLVGALLGAGCTENPYYIGAACRSCAGGSGGGDSTLSFALDLDASGVSQLDSTLALDRAVSAALQFRSEKAGPSGWPSEQGEVLSLSTGSPALSDETPFTDATRAFAQSSARYTASSESVGDVESDDFALELVLRAAASTTFLDKRGTGVGWSLASNATGSLVLTARDAQRTFELSGAPLTNGAWYHCLIWLSHRAGARIDCDGREGTLNAVGALGRLSSSSRLSLGDASGSNAQLALISLYRAADLGTPDHWSTVARARFAKLSGVLPRVARGSLLPQSGLRDSVANIDFTRADGTRRLLLVGADWPRVACRNDTSGARLCGYLAEPQRTRRVKPEPSDWQSRELVVQKNSGDFADGARRTSALVASTASSPHTLSWLGTYGGARQVLSLFARARRGHLLAVQVSGFERALFDLGLGRELLSPNGVEISVEDWGNGLFRCSYAFAPVAGGGELRYGLELWANADGTPFAGDGTSAFLELAELQLDLNLAQPGLPLAVDSQPADQLSFDASDGNVPNQNDVTQRLRVLLPAGPRLTDQALLNLNRGGSFDTQVQLYVRGDTSQLQFWGLRDSETHWSFSHPVSLTDGLRHDIRAEWTASRAALTVDDVTLEQTAILPNQPFDLDRIDVSFSRMSSGSLEGLIGGIELGPLPP